MSTPRPRILVVDDSPTSRGVLVAMLEDRYEVHTARDGIEAIAQVVGVMPDLVLMDVVMPVLDGHGACIAMRADPLSAALPILLVTSQDSEQDVEVGYRSGCNDYVLKPVDQAELMMKVACWLSTSLEAQRS